MFKESQSVLMDTKGAISSSSQKERGVCCVRPSAIGRILRYRPPSSTSPDTDLLRDPRSHLSSVHRYGKECYPIYSRGSTADIISRWHSLPNTVQNKIESAGFGTFLDSLPVADRDRKLSYALAERWWDTTNKFHLPFGEMTLTPLDFTATTGLRVGGRHIPWDLKVNRCMGYVEDLLGWAPKIIAKGSVRVSEIIHHFDMEDIDENNEKQVSRLTCCFFLYILGRTLFCNTGDTIQLWCLPALENVDMIGEFNWGGAAMSVLYRFMCAVSRQKTKSMGGFSFVWEVWAYEVLGISPFRLRVPEEGLFPRMARWREENRSSRLFPSTFSNFCTAIDELRGDMVRWRPWESINFNIDDYGISIKNNASRLILDGLIGRYFFLGDRVTKQVLADGQVVQPGPPPPEIQNADTVNASDVTELLQGLPCQQFFPKTSEFDTYEEFVKQRLMGDMNIHSVEEICFCYWHCADHIS